MRTSEEQERCVSALKQDFDYLMGKKLSLALFKLDTSRTGIRAQDLPQMSASLFSELDISRTHVIREADLEKAINNMKERIDRIQNEMQKVANDKIKALETRPSQSDVEAWNKNQFAIQFQDQMWKGLHKELHNTIQFKAEAEDLFVNEFNRTVCMFLLSPLTLVDRPLEFENVDTFMGIDEDVKRRIAQFSKPLKHVGPLALINQCNLDTVGRPCAGITGSYTAKVEKMAGLERPASMPQTPAHFLKEERPVTEERVGPTTAVTGRSVSEGYERAPLRGDYASEQRTQIPRESFVSQQQQPSALPRLAEQDFSKERATGAGVSGQRFEEERIGGGGVSGRQQYQTSEWERLSGGGTRGEFQAPGVLPRATATGGGAGQGFEEERARYQQLQQPTGGAGKGFEEERARYQQQQQPSAGKGFEEERARYQQQQQQPSGVSAQGFEAERGGGERGWEDRTKYSRTVPIQDVESGTKELRPQTQAPQQQSQERGPSSLIQQQERIPSPVTTIPLERHPTLGEETPTRGRESLLIPTQTGRYGAQTTGVESQKAAGAPVPPVTLPSEGLDFGPKKSSDFGTQVIPTQERQKKFEQETSDLERPGGTSRVETVQPLEQQQQQQPSTAESAKSGITDFFSRLTSGSSSEKQTQEQPSSTTASLRGPESTTGERSSAGRRSITIPVHEEEFHHQSPRLDPLRSRPLGVNL
jgi:hypothetical protein